jgi:hypothetical protein
MPVHLIIILEKLALLFLFSSASTERQWILSGTPTTGDEDSIKFNSKGLNQLQRLLIFLHHKMNGINPSPSNADTNSYISKSTRKD